MQSPPRYTVTTSLYSHHLVIQSPPRYTATTSSFSLRHPYLNEQPSLAYYQPLITASFVFRPTTTTPSPPPPHPHPLTPTPSHTHPHTHTLTHTPSHTHPHTHTPRHNALSVYSSAVQYGPIDFMLLHKRKQTHMFTVTRHKKNAWD